MKMYTVATLVWLAALLGGCSPGDSPPTAGASTNGSGGRGGQGGQPGTGGASTNVDAAGIVDGPAAAPGGDAANGGAGTPPPGMGGAAGATDGGSNAAGDGGGARADARAIDWPAVTDFAAAGPFATTRDKNVGPNAAYDVFRPGQLGQEGRKHPIISWANGTLFALDKYQMLLLHWASHGFVVIAAHTNTTAGGATHKAGIDWLIAEAGRSGSVFFGVIDGQKIGASGHSQGGGATIAAGSNKPGPTGITATLPLMPLLRFEADETVVQRQVAPMFNVNATMDDRDPMGKIAETIFAGATGALVQGAFVGIHEDAMNVAMHGPTLAWFRAQLMNDQLARDRFYPPAACGLCKDPAWKQIRHKN
jgi:hypothetical protein